MGQKCSRQMIIIHAYDNTIVNPDFTFTAKEISGLFGCSTQSAINMINKLKVYGSVSAVGNLKRDFYQMFRINESGKKYAEKVKTKLEIDDMNSTIEADKAGVTA